MNALVERETRRIMHPLTVRMLSVENAQEEFFDDFKTRVETLDVRATKIFKICCGDVRHHILMSPRHQDQD